MYPDTQLYIDGQWRNALAGKTLPVTNPATDEVIGQVAHAATEDLDLALAATERGFNVWRDTAAHQRANLMRKAAALLRERANAIAAVMTQEQGKPVAQAKVEILNAADVIDWFAGEATRTYGQIIPSRARDVQQQTLKLPVGPVAAFTPWNFPINQIVRKLSAALAAGCSIIVKGPEETPASPAELIKAFADAGIPAGVIALVYGTPAEISEYLIPHPAIRKISFTGSTRVGKHLAALAGQHMKKATMELGGHAPVLIFDDADLDAAAKELAQSKFRNAGHCPQANRWKYGLEAFPAHLQRTADAARRRYAAADITYLAAAEDTGAAPGAYYRILDKSCAAQLQGPYRLQRALAYADYDRHYLAPEKPHRLTIVPGCGHNVACVFSAPAARQALFPINAD
ncbi:aldehyde dehydrogenase family protein [Serratia marcescens]|uniref:aldehyde dehydrogenase family protein n=1 Tax=Serratia marcescens TaxID=615 RepID=UPI000744E307|nr:aldehyde dehydrogenase family protein [Serratia marcescens]CVE21436.1 Succinate-semialdehyde dehydrogenase [NADP(+)] GabD [Serratia marcescens]